MRRVPLMHEARHARGLAILRQIGGPEYDGPIGRLARVSPDMAASLSTIPTAKFSRAQVSIFGFDSSATWARSSRRDPFSLSCDFIWKAC